MGMTPRLWSLNALAVELDRNPRTVAKALRYRRPDGKLGRHDAWRLRTALGRMLFEERRRTEREGAGDELLTTTAASEAASRSPQCLRNWAKRHAIGYWSEAAQRYLISRPAFAAYWRARFGADTLPPGLRDG